ncbi:MAG: sensor histidine kinase [Chloroflexi bacterium]|nr:sensor histidine kinase [Chloroflexota bacterium]
MPRLTEILTKLAANKIASAGCIVLLSAMIAYLAYISRPELLLDVFYGLPIILGLLSFGRWGGWVVATTSIIGFYFSNYYSKGVDFGEAWLSTLITYAFFLLFSFGAYRFLLNQRKLNEVQSQLQTRLNVQDQLHRQSQLLHQQNLQVAVINERNRIAREIHDVLAQGLMAIILKVEVAFLEKDIPAPVKQKLHEIDELARYHLQEARRSVADLRPLPLDGKNLQEALQFWVDTIKVKYQLETEFDTSGEIRPLSTEIETALYRIAQEALNNVGQHSKADRVSVNLDYDEEEICLTVQDNGVGFDLTPGFEAGNNSKNPKSYGLRTMQERADMVGGWIALQTAPMRGCRVRVSVPYQSPFALKPGSAGSTDTEKIGNENENERTERI